MYMAPSTVIFIHTIIKKTNLKSSSIWHKNVIKEKKLVGPSKILVRNLNWDIEIQICLNSFTLFGTN